MDYDSLVEMWIQGNREGVLESLLHDEPDNYTVMYRVLKLSSIMTEDDQNSLRGYMVLYSSDGYSRT